MHMAAGGSLGSANAHSVVASAESTTSSRSSGMGGREMGCGEEVYHSASSNLVVEACRSSAWWHGPEGRLVGDAATSSDGAGTSVATAAEVVWESTQLQGGIHAPWHLPHNWRSGQGVSPVQSSTAYGPVTGPTVVQDVHGRRGSREGEQGATDAKRGWLRSLLPCLACN
jgi:hypothetical protein